MQFMPLVMTGMMAWFPSRPGALLADQHGAVDRAAVAHQSSGRGRDVEAFVTCRHRPLGGAGTLRVGSSRQVAPVSANDTIAAIASARGPGRGRHRAAVSGPEVPRIARAMLGGFPPRGARGLRGFSTRSGETHR